MIEPLFDRKPLQLIRPLVVGGVRMTAREILDVGARSLDNILEWGEASPLPGLHEETTDDAHTALSRPGFFDALFAATTFTECCELLADEAPTVRFAAESIWLGVQSHRHGTVPARLLNPDARDVVDVCALMVAERGAVVPPRARAVKIKIGRGEPAEERRRLDTLLDVLDPSVEVRLDANRAWSLDEAVERLRGLDPKRISYVEEPLADPANLPVLYASTGLKMALDESLHEPGRETLYDADCVAAFVVKPSRCGISQTLAWDTRAWDRGKRVVISSCFEGNVGTSMLAQIAAALRTDGGAAGLGTISWFDSAGDVLGYDEERGYYVIDDWAVK